MNKRTVLTTIVAFVLLVAVIAAGINAVFTVTYVDARFVTYTTEGERAAQEMKEDLNGYLGRSTTFLDLSEVRATAAAYPRFKIVTIDKQYPASVIVEVTERRAAFALAAGDAWDIFDTEGYRIGTSTSAAGYVLIGDGFSLSTEQGLLTGGYAAELLDMYGAFCAALGEPRANLLSVSLDDMSTAGSLEFDNFRIATTEGVEIVISEPSVRAAEKAAAAAEVYLSLQDGERVRGSITAVISALTEKAEAHYSADAPSV